MLFCSWSSDRASCINGKSRAELPTTYEGSCPPLNPMECGIFGTPSDTRRPIRRGLNGSGGEVNETTYARNKISRLSPPARFPRLPGVVLLSDEVIAMQRRKQGPAPVSPP